MNKVVVKCGLYCFLRGFPTKTLELGPINEHLPFIVRTRPPYGNFENASGANKSTYPYMVNVEKSNSAALQLPLFFLWYHHEGDVVWAAVSSVDWKHMCFVGQPSG